PVTPEVAGSSPVAPAIAPGIDRARHRLRPAGVCGAGPRGGMESLLSQYFPILVFLAIAGGLALAMVGASLVLARQNPNSEKLSPYECGFEPFEDARVRFDVRYYLVAILFIIFDLEVAFLFPWAVSLGDIGVFGFW